MFVRRTLYRNFRLFYRLSRRFRYRLTPTGLLILSILIVSGVFGIDTRQTLAFQIFSICFLLLFISFLYVFTFRGKFTIMRQLPDHATSGESLNYHCRISNQSARPCKGLFVSDELESQFPTFEEFIQQYDPNDKNRNIFDRFFGYPKLANLIQTNRGGVIKPSMIDYIAGNGNDVVSLKLVPLRRGYIYFSRLRIGQTDPLGLIRSFKTYNIRDKLLILPRLYNAPFIPFRTRRLLQHGGISMASSVGESHEFISLRDYRPGDPLRSIHWRSYAKRTQPVVKEHQDEYFSRFGMVLDTFANSHTEILFEEAVSIAASFIITMKHQDSLLDLLFVGTEAFQFTSGRGLADTVNMLEILACVKICKSHSFIKLTKLFEKNAANCSGLVCILMEFDDERKKFIELLREFNIPAVCLIIDSGDLTPEKYKRYETGKVLISPLRFSNIQHDLDSLDSGRIKTL